MNRADETIAALATPPGKGAIAIVRVSGPQTRDLAARVFRSRSPLQPRVATYGTIIDDTGRTIDRGLAILAHAPHSYTGDDTLELHVHGSPVVVRELLGALIAAGARYAAPGEFTRRAFFNGKLDLRAASAVADVIDAETRAAARAAVANLGGELARRIRALREDLARVLEELAASIDFPDEVPTPDRTQLQNACAHIARNLRAMQRDAEVGKLAREGIAVAIVGPPNAGKSSLLNAMLGEERALVSEIPGTTRDTIEESISVKGIAVRLIDTAGIRAHADRLEAAGIERTERALQQSAIALVVVDGSQPLGAEAREVLARTQDRPRVVFANKADLGEVGARALDGALTVKGSVYDHATLVQLREAISAAALGEGAIDLAHPHLVSAAELDAVARAVEGLDQAHAILERGDPVDLITRELQSAHASLGHLTADAASEELLNGIFARFCIGK